MEDLLKRRISQLLPSYFPPSPLLMEAGLGGLVGAFSKLWILLSRLLMPTYCYLVCELLACLSLCGCSGSPPYSSALLHVV